MLIVAFVVLVLVLSNASFITAVRGPPPPPPPKPDDGRVIYPDSDIYQRPNRDYPHHHHHHHYGDYHDHNYHQPDERGQFQQTFEAMSDNITTNSDFVGIPLDFAKEINHYDLDDLLHNFVEGMVTTQRATPLLKNRFSEASDTEDGMERTVRTNMPTRAKCMPELTTVDIVPAEGSNFFYIPECTRVERCGGCCSHKLLSCQPEETETLRYEVIKTEYSGTKKLRYVGKELILVEKHTKCKCACKIKREDCNSYQEYREGPCTCVCTNTDEMNKCDREYSRKRWNSDTCKCECIQIQLCSTGYTYDLNECRCKEIPMRRRFTTSEQKVTYEPEVLPIE